jgi:hypothetical protein
MALHPGFDVPLFQLGDWQGPAESAEIVEQRFGVIAMLFAERAVGHTTFAVLEVFRTRLRDEPVVGRCGRRFGTPTLPKLHTSQGETGSLFIVDTSNSIAILIEQRHTLFASWQCVVPTVGLLPMPG